MVLGQEALVEIVHAAIRIADAHGAEGITVIAAAQGDKLGPGRPLACQYCCAILSATHSHRTRSARNTRSTWLA